MTGQPELSVIVPFYDEEGNVARVHSAIVHALDPLGIPFEMIFVDDGSRDRTLALATAIARTDPRVTVVSFRRNFGQTAATVAGIEHARGKVLVTMDGDLQNDPLDIEHLFRMVNEGYDVVVGWRHRRHDHLLSRRIPSTVANWLIGKVTGVSVRDIGCSLKAYRTSFIRGIPLYVDMHRFIPAMAAVAGPSIAEVKVRHHARQFGRSKYGLSRSHKVLLDLMVVKMVTSFAERPLLWFSLLALPLALLGTAAIADSIWRWLALGDTLPLPVAGSGVIFLTAAIILVSSGFLAELVYRVGDSRERDFSRLTARVWNPSDRTMMREVAGRA